MKKPTKQEGSIHNLNHLETFKKSEDRFNSFIELTGQIAWVTNAKGEVVEDVPSLRKFSGQTYKEAKGSGWAKALHPDDLKRSLKVWNKAVITKSFYEIEYRMRRHDGVYRYLLARSFPVLREDGSILEWVGTCIDITERKLAEEALRESQEKYYYLYENSPVGMYHTKIDGSGIIEINNSACEMLGFTKEELIGQPSAIRWADPNRRNEILKILKEYGVANNFDAEILKKDGSKFSCLLSMKIFKEKGYIEGFMIDISERKRADDQIRSFSEELEQKVRDLDKAVTDLKRSNQELEQFAYVASHDLQEPLRMVSSYTQLLERRYKDQLDQDAKDFINFAVDGANRMQHLINDLLEFSRVTTKGKPMTTLDLSDVLGQAVANLQNKIQETGSMIVNEDLPFAYGDEGQLIRVFQNLLDNAMKFRGDESPRINITAKTIEDEVQISITDNGIGIDKIYSERVFTIFQRLHTKADYPGTGIGLAICKRTIERHGGKIWFESEPGKGTTFCFTLKIK